MSGAFKIGSEILVNTTTLGAQEAPVITGLTNGGFVVTWTDFSQTGGDTSIGALRAQIFDASGGKAGGEFLVPTTTTGTQNMGAIAALTDGRFIVGWQDASRGAGDNSGSAVRAQIFNAEGSKSGSEFLLPATTFSHQDEPAIARLPHGRFVAAWTDSSGTGDLQPTGIRAQVFDAGGTRSGAEFLVNTTTGNSQQAPTITGLADGHFVAAWADESVTGDDLSSAAIRAQVFASDGARQGNEFLVNTTTSSAQLDPTITGRSDVRFVVAWTDLSQSGGDLSGYAVRAQIFNGDGSRAGGEFLVNTTTDSLQQQPSLAALPDGRFVAVWADASGDMTTQYGVRAQVFDGDGHKAGAEFLVNTTVPGAQWRPAVTTLGDGGFAVAWEDQSATGGDMSSYAVRAQIFHFGELPVIASGGGGDTATVSVAENTNGVTALVATDADSAALAYSIVGGADAAKFQIDAVTGELSFISAPDFEDPGDTGSHNSYEVTVRASDGFLSDDQTITVNVTNVNEAPVITSNGGVATAIIYAPEGTSAVTTVTASDPDAGTTLHFSLAGGPDEALFHIDAATGALSLNHVPDYETPLDAAHINSYKVFVRASDGALSSDQLVIFRVTDANEAPAITSDGGAANASVTVLENTTAVTTVRASDPDSGAVLHYSISGGADALLFQVDNASGALSFVAAPDFEAPVDADHDNSYQVVVRASDGSLFDDQAINVGVSDVPDNVTPVVKFGDEFLVNTTTFGHQTASAIAGSANGRFIATWTDGSRSGDDNSFDAIRAQIFNADGTRLGGEFLVNSTTAGSQDEPAVAALSDGRYVAAWTDYYQAGSNGTVADIRAQLFNADGSRAGAEITVSASGSHLSTPVLGALADGGFVAAWVGSDGSAEGIHAQLFHADGTKSAGEFPVNTTTVNPQNNPAITPLANGNFVVAWSDYSATGGDQSLAAVRAQVFHPDGTRAGSEFLVNTTTASFQLAPAITGLANGNFVAVWSDASQTAGDTDKSAVRGQVFNADGSRSGAEFLVNTTTAFGQDHPTIAALRDGRFVAAWVDTIPGNDQTWNQAIRAQVFNRDGTKSSAEFLIDTTDSLRFDPTITPLADGRFAITWSDGTQTGGDASGVAIHGQIFDPRVAAVHIKGTLGNDDYVGTGFDDTMRGGAGNDRLDGGAGEDTAIYLHNVADYTLQALGGGRFIVSGPEGTDKLANFEHLRFIDRALDTADLHAPQITSDGGSDTAALSVDAHQTAVTTVSATDADPGTTLSYAIGGGADAARFTLDAATGALSFVTAPADSGHDPVYVVQVRVSDGVLTDTQAITVSVTDESAMVCLTGTPGDDTFAALSGNERIDALGGNDTVSFNFKLTDAVVTYAGNQVIVDGPSSHTILTGFERFAFTDGVVDNRDGDPLVDDLFYYSHNHDVWDAHVGADAHYHTYGWHEGRDPSAFFATSLYLALNPDVRAAGVDPLIHFDQFGWHEGRIPSFAFDAAAYSAANPDVAAAQVDSLWHFLQCGAQEGRQPFAPSEPIAANGFDYLYYLQHNPDVAAAGVDPLWHFNQSGWHELRNPNAFFDTRGYLAAYADVAAAGVNPLDHYHASGWAEGRDPSTSFDTAGYLSQNPDVATAHIDPLLHFLHFGQNEGRVAVADGLWG